jgi:hypothetical protein
LKNSQNEDLNILNEKNLLIDITKEKNLKDLNAEKIYNFLNEKKIFNEILKVFILKGSLRAHIFYKNKQKLKIKKRGDK